MSGKQNPTLADFVEFSGRGTIRERHILLAIRNKWQIT